LRLSADQIAALESFMAEHVQECAAQ
jgi:hypothetical protein